MIAELRRRSLQAILIASLVWSAVQSSQLLGIDILPGQRDQLAGSTCELRMQCPTAQSPTQLRWKLMVGERTLKVGQSLIIPEVPSHQKTYCRMDFETPEVNLGVSLFCSLILESEALKDPIVVPMSIWHQDVFAESRLHETRICFFDPEEKMKNCLQSQSLGASFATRLKDVGNADFIVVAEEVPWDEPLGHAIFYNWLSQGRKILVLRGSNDRAFSLTWSGIKPDHVGFSKLAGSRWLSKEQDHDYWKLHPVGSTLRIDFSPRGLILGPRYDTVLDDDNHSGWQIAEITTTQGAVCLFLGVPLVSNWDKSAYPRLCLKQILEKLNQPTMGPSQSTSPKR